MSTARSPALSVVIATPDRYETIRKTMGYLRAQTAREQLELVIVAPSADELGLDASELESFCGVCVVQVGDFTSIGAVNAAGVRHAHAPVVAFGEDHAYPDPHWAEALIEAHHHPWAAVGPTLRNANPESVISWADFLIAYAPWADPTPAAVVEHLPGHNSSYKREILLAYGGDLAAMLEAETILHWNLRARQHQLYLEPAAKVAHVNFARLSAWTTSLFYCGRVFAATRARAGHWPALRRLLHAGAAPLIPLVRLWRVLPVLRRLNRCENLPPGILPVLLFGLVVDAAGQLLGYACGAGGAKHQVTAFEYHREDHVRGGKRARRSLMASPLDARKRSNPP